MTVFVGVEGGATRATAVATDASGNMVARTTDDAIVLAGGDSGATVDALVRIIRHALDAAGTTRARAVSCNLTGAGRPKERIALEQALARFALADQIAVGTDAEAALTDAFDAGPGIILIAGTGSIAWGRSEKGEVARAGGWGPIAGDEGSAFDIGRNALHAVLAASDGRGESTTLTNALLSAADVQEVPQLVRWAESAGKKGVAGLAPLAIEEARRDPMARAIEMRAVSDLALHVTALATRLGPWSAGPPVALAGGLLASGRPLRDPLRHRIIALLPGVAFLDRDVDGARGAAMLARRLVI